MMVEAALWRLTSVHGAEPISRRAGVSRFRVVSMIAKGPNQSPERRVLAIAVLGTHVSFPKSSKKLGLVAEELQDLTS